MTRYASDTVVSVGRFTRQPDGEDILIGNPENGTFLAVPAEAVEVLDYLAQGRTLQQASEFCREKYGEPLDIDDFIGIMEAKGFVATAETGGNSQPERPVVPPASSLRYHFSDFPQPVARFLYGRASLLFCLLLTAVAGAAMVADQSLVPHPADLVFPQYRVISFLTFLFLAFGSMFLHELSHVVAARALGVNSKLGIGHRMWFLVAEADLTGLWAVSKKQRYLPLIAGIITDAVSAASLVLLLYAQDAQWIHLSIFVIRICKALVMSYWLRILWQFYVFIRTDIYFVITNYFDCRNLLSDTEEFLKNCVSRLFRSGRLIDQSHIPAAERRVIRVYSVLWLGGRVLALYVLFAVTLPVVYGYLHDLFSAFRTGVSANIDGFIDSLLLSFFVVTTLSAGLFLWIRGMIRRERA
jgi:putative peptide zinc metalloprotease protein